MPDPSAIERHYSHGGLADRILQGLEKAGKDPSRLRPEDLAPVDQLHMRGRAGVLELATLAGVQQGWHVLDIGGGLGGPARVLASELRCQVTVLDITEEFVQVGALLSERMDLAGLVHFRHGSALDMPYTDERFDVAWTQHSTMNIADKERLYGEAFRVLRPGGRLAMHEVVAGPVQPIHFPAPWAADASASFLLPQAELRQLIARFGFRELAWRDVTAESLEWFKRVAAVPLPQPTLPPLGIHLVLGETAPRLMRSQMRDVEERRLEVVQAVFERP